MGQDLWATYRPLRAQRWDELMAENGQPRAVWQPFLEHIAAIGVSALQHRFARADAHLASSGVVHRVYGDGDGLRPWPLSHMPVLMGADEWAALSQGVAERATLLNHLLRDAYGPRHFISSGFLPAAFYAGSPEWARPMISDAPTDAPALRFYAVDVGRGPDGQFYVLSDRTQAPSGAGYALENRLTLARALPDLYRSLQIERLAGFFQEFRAHLVSLKHNPDARIGLMSPGPMNETYFEHSYLARYLGFVLVEGEDLVVRDGALFIRTVAGLQPCDVLWRRVDTDFTDPLAFNTRSRLGVPGLAEIARQGAVTLANALGSGLAESRAWMAALPDFALKINGAPLSLRTQKTYWGFDEKARAIIAERFDELIIGSAFGAELPGIGSGFARGADLSRQERDALLAYCERRGVDVIGQEPIALSTTPIFVDGQLVPRPFVLRLFAAWTGQEWRVMPGGLARISATENGEVASLQRGARSADVWVMSSGPVANTTLLRGADQPRIRRSPGSLPSRAADNLFWLGRYVERTEFMVRLGRAALARHDRHEANIYEAIAAVLTAWGALLPFPPGAPLPHAALGRTLLQSEAPPQSVLALSRAALASASTIRDRFSPDAWRVLNEFMALIKKPLADDRDDVEADERMRDALRVLSSFAGLAQENMNRLTGWRFLDLGRRIERAIGMARLIARFASDDPWACDLLLELGDSTLTYRLRYVDVHERVAVTDLLLLDPANPRSVAFQMQKIAEHLSIMPGAKKDGQLSPAAALALQLQTELTVADAKLLSATWPDDFASRLLQLSDAVASHHVRPIEREGGRHVV